jgi:hypothetical protein
MVAATCSEGSTSRLVRACTAPASAPPRSAPIVPPHDASTRANERVTCQPRQVGRVN